MANTKKATSRMLSETTTDLDIIRTMPSRFVWGQVTAIHDIGPYTFVETDEGGFHVYVDGKDTCHSATTLDRALIIAVARKNLEANTARWMGQACWKLLGIEFKDGE